MIKRFILFAAFAVLWSQTAARAYVLLPTPQKILFQGDTLPVGNEPIAVSSTIGDDARILNSLKQIFNNTIVTPDPMSKQNKGVVVYAADKSDATTKSLCEKMLCADIDPAAMPAQGYFLGIRKIDGRVVVLILFSKPHGAFYATKTLKQLYENNSLPEISIHDWPDFEARGILEGFYGEPWPAAKRTAMIPWMADYKFNGYMYAPKDDHKIRFGWRVGFTEKELDRFKRDADLARENFVQYCWELSPGININFSNTDDLKRAYKKFKSIIDGAGIDCIILAFDDVGFALTSGDQGKFATYWEAQISFTNKLMGKLLEDYPALRVAFVPNDYWGNLVEESEYLRYVGEHLDPRLQFGWTGSKIIPETVTPADAQLYEYYIKRKPFLGDNYPVTDNVTKGGRLSLGPLRGRDPALFRYVSGYAANAMPLPEASKPAFLTIADYTWNPFAYDAETSWKNAARVLGGDTGADALLFFFKQNESSLIWKYDALELFEAVRGLLRAFKKMPDYDFATYATRCNALFARFAGIDAELGTLSSPENAAMLDEMAPWIQKLKQYGELGQRTAALLESKYNGKAPAAADIDALEADWKTTEQNTATVTKMVMFNFMLRSLAALRDQPEPTAAQYKSLMTDE